MSQSIEIELSGSFHPQWGITEDDCNQLTARLVSAREETVSGDLDLIANGEIPAEKQPLDGHFYLLPEKLLSHYKADPSASDVGKILAVATRLQASTEAVVILGIGGSYMGARALMEACCEPFYNELSKRERDGRPRIYFAGYNLDNDALQGVLSRLEADASAGKWGLIVVSKSGQTLETAVAFRTLLQVLKRQHPEDVPGLVVPITGDGGSLNQIAAELGCQDIFRVPEGVGGRFSVLSPVGLLPAATMGLDVVSLLQGAADMNELFRTAPVGSNPVLDYAAAAFLMQTKRSNTIRVLSVWQQALESVGLWYDQLLAESLGKAGQGATPITMVNTRDLHSRAQQHQAGRADKWIVNLSVRQSRTDPVELPAIEMDADGLKDLVNMPIRKLSDAAQQGTNLALAEAGRPTMKIIMQSADEYGLGQFFQMMMLATVIEGRLLGVNPYGQPGVEAYKRHMRSILNL